MKFLKNFLLCCSLLSIVLSCSNATEPEINPAPPAARENNGAGDTTITIMDRTGKEWDVTHAEKRYGLKADQFQFGIGQNAIPPILQPQFVDSSDAAFPSTSSTFLVIGANFNGDKRAYPISVLNRHEIVDEKFGDQHVAVGY